MNLTNYLEFLENSKKFKEMDKAERAQMLGEINELIKADPFWVRNSGKDEVKRRIKNALFERLYLDIKDEIVDKIKEQKITIFSVFSKALNQKYPKELKEHRKRGDIDFAVAFGRGKDESGEAIFANTFIVFARNSSFDLRSLDSLEFQNKINSSKLIDFCSNCEIDLNALKELCFDTSKLLSLDFTHAKALFYERLCDEIINANRQIIGSITCYTARSLWSDNYNVSSYFKGLS